MSPVGELPTVNAHVMICIDLMDVGIHLPVRTRCAVACPAVPSEKTAAMDPETAFCCNHADPSNDYFRDTERTPYLCSYSLDALPMIYRPAIPDTYTGRLLVYIQLSLISCGRCHMGKCLSWTALKIAEVFRGSRLSPVKAIAKRCCPWTIVSSHSHVDVTPCTYISSH
jgi:hypothetical protein